MASLQISLSWTLGCQRMHLIFLFLVGSNLRRALNASDYRLNSFLTGYLHVSHGNFGKAFNFLLQNSFKILYKMLIKLIF